MVSADNIGQGDLVSEREQEWVAENYGQLRQEYGGQWIVVLDAKILAHGEVLEKLNPELAMLNAYVEYIPPPDEDLPILAV